MLSSSKNDEKQEARYSSRLDVLTERVDTLAATVATTASSTAKTDGELVGLRRDLQTAVARVEAAIAGAAPSAGSAGLDELTARVAALAAERPSQADDRRLDDLNLMLLRLNERVDALAAAPAPDEAPSQEELERLDTRTEAALAEIRAHVAALATPTRPRSSCDSTRSTRARMSWRDALRPCLPKSPRRRPRSSSDWTHSTHARPHWTSA